MATYKVWIGVERYCEDGIFGGEAVPEYEDLDLPFGGEGEFDSEAEAVRFATSLHERFAPLGAMVAEYERVYLSGDYDLDGEDVSDYEAREDDLLEIADLALAAFGRRFVP